MQIYPGYTIDRIDEELSLRQVKLLLDENLKEPSLYATMREINQMLKSFLGIKETPKLIKGKAYKPEEAAEVLKQLMMRR